MWYFAYGSDLNSKSLLEWSERLGLVPPARSGPKGAILRNYRLCFPVYDEAWDGGVADVVPEPGKFVAGVLFNIHRISLQQLDRLFLPESDESRSRLHARVRVTVPVYPYSGGEAVQAITYRLRRPEWRHVSPTSRYIERMVEAAGKFGLSSLWVMHLQSFTDQPDRHFRADFPHTPLRESLVGDGLGCAAEDFLAAAAAG
jgi:gamma-glutamylcyclotransferase